MAGGEARRSRVGGSPCPAPSGARRRSCRGAPNRSGRIHHFPRATTVSGCRTRAGAPARTRTRRAGSAPRRRCAHAGRACPLVRRGWRPRPRMTRSGTAARSSCGRAAAQVRSARSESGPPNAAWGSLSALLSSDGFLAVDSPPSIAKRRSSTPAGACTRALPPLDAGCGTRNPLDKMGLAVGGRSQRTRLLLCGPDRVQA